MQQLRYVANASNFAKIPGSPIAYWASKMALKAYNNANLDAIAQPRHGLATSDNNRFLRLWHEVSIKKSSVFEKDNYKHKWFPMNKGGAYRKWYGNLEWLINYENNGKELKEFAISIYKCSSRTIQNTQFYFKKGLTWSALTSGSFSVRFSEAGAIFGSGGYSAFVDDSLILYILALMNNIIAKTYIGFISPTLNYEVGHIKTLPAIIDKAKAPKVNNLVEDCITISKTDWDSFENSWDFKKHPLI